MGVRAFLPSMQEAGGSRVIINCGSKQGITNPPGRLVYNMSKSALKTYTEGLEHELRNGPDGPDRVSAHLLIPGWTTTAKNAHRDGAWVPEQVIDYLLAHLNAGDFYIICPDGEVSADMDKRRIAWAAGDLIENRPPLSRWHADYRDQFTS